jgi:hypothetical protein
LNKRLKQLLAQGLNFKRFKNEKVAFSFFLPLFILYLIRVSITNEKKMIDKLKIKTKQKKLLGIRCNLE